MKRLTSQTRRPEKGKKNTSQIAKALFQSSIVTSSGSGTIRKINEKGGTRAQGCLPCKLGLNKKPFAFSCLIFLVRLGGQSLQKRNWFIKNVKKYEKTLHEYQCFVLHLPYMRLRDNTA
jgi:hypothetical protein